MARRAGGLTDRDREWKGHLEKVASRGVTAKAYAREQGLSYHALYQAKKRLRALGAWPVHGKTAALSFARVAVRDEAAAPGFGACRLRLADVATIEWEVAPSAEVLGSVIERALRR